MHERELLVSSPKHLELMHTSPAASGLSVYLSQLGPSMHFRHQLTAALRFSVCTTQWTRAHDRSSTACLQAGQNSHWPTLMDYALCSAYYKCLLTLQVW